MIFYRPYIVQETGWKVGYKTFSLFYNHVLGIKEDGSLWAWGNNRYGQLGLGFASGTDEVTQLDPIRVGTDNDWKMVSTGPLSTIALKNDGTFWGWGNDDSGNLAGSPGVSPAIIVPGTWIDIGCNFDSSVGIRSDGTFWGTGRNSNGQLGIGNYVDQTSFVQEMTRATDWGKIVSNELNPESILLLKTNRDFYFAGAPFLQGVIPWDFQDYFPFRLAAPGPWKAIASSSGHVLGIKTDGTLWSWGANASGELGKGITSRQSLPATQVGTQTNWVDVSAGFDYSTALNELGELYSFGSNSNGVLGVGSRKKYSASPVLVSDGILQIKAGSVNTFAISDRILNIPSENNYTAPDPSVKLVETFSGTGSLDEHLSDSGHVWENEAGLTGQIELLSVNGGLLNMGSNSFAAFPGKAGARNNRILPESYSIELDFLVDLTKVSNDGPKEDQIDLILGVNPNGLATQSGVAVSFLFQNSSIYIYMFSQIGGFASDSYAELTISSTLSSGMHSVRVNLTPTSKIVLLDNNEIMRTESTGTIYPVSGNACLFYQDLNNGRYKLTRIEEIMNDPSSGALFIDTFSGSGNLATHTPDVGSAWINGGRPPYTNQPSGQQLINWNLSNGKVQLRQNNPGQVRNLSGPSTANYPFTLQAIISINDPGLTPANFNQFATVALWDNDANQAGLYFYVGYTNTGNLTVDATAYDSDFNGGAITLYTGPTFVFGADYVVTAVANSRTSVTFYIGNVNLGTIEILSPGLPDMPMLVLGSFSGSSTSTTTINNPDTIDFNEVTIKLEARVPTTPLPT